MSGGGERDRYEEEEGGINPDNISIDFEDLVAAGAVVEVVANGHIDVEEEEEGINLDNIPNDVEDLVAAGAVVEVVANGHMDVEEEEANGHMDVEEEEGGVNLDNIPIYVEAETSTRFDFMADHYARSPVAATADPAVAEEVPEIVGEVAGGGAVAEEVPEVVEGGNVAEEDPEVVAEVAEGDAVEVINPVHVPPEVVAGEAEGAFMAEEDVAGAVIVAERETWILTFVDGPLRVYRCYVAGCGVTRIVIQNEGTETIFGEHVHDNE